MVKMFNVDLLFTFLHLENNSLVMSSKIVACRAIILSQVELFNPLETNMKDESFIYRKNWSEFIK